MTDALDLKKANFAGNSLGGQVLLAFVRRHPERLNRSLARYAAGLVLDRSQESPICTAVLSKMYAQKGFIRCTETTIGADALDRQRLGQELRSFPVPAKAAIGRPRPIVWD